MPSDKEKKLGELLREDAPLKRQRKSKSRLRGKASSMSSIYLALMKLKWRTRDRAEPSSFIRVRMAMQERTGQMLSSLPPPTRRKAPPT